MVVSKSDLNWHRFLQLYFAIYLEVLVSIGKIISNTSESVLSHFQTPQSSSKILCCALYFQLSSLCLEVQ